MFATMCSVKLGLLTEDYPLETMAGVYRKTHSGAYFLPKR